MNNHLLVPEDMNFLLKSWLKAEDLIDGDTLSAFLDLSEEVAEAQFLSHYKRSDVDEPQLGPDGVRVCADIIPALRQYAELGFFSAGFPEELGGLGLPFLACSASFAWFAAANVATAAYPMLTVANARLIATFGNERQIDYFARPQITGDWFGTMCLSEPQAGSSLGDIRTRAVPDGADEFGARYRIAGNKMWISGGDQNISENIVHLVLAKVPDADGTLPEGTPGISLFIVPKVLPDGGRNDIAVAGINHKMGYRGTANCLLNFGEKGGAIGWRVGAAGQGLRQMFQMMNEARISVGLGAAALGYRSYRLSVRYAKDRCQGRPIGQRGGAPIPIIDHIDVRQMLLAQKAYVEGALALCLYSARLVDLEETDADATTILELLTPVTKTWPSEHGLLANDLAIQIHGGYGYTRDFDVEQLWRDNRLNPIHEGTTGVQAIDLLGRKILRDRRGIDLLGDLIGKTAMSARQDVLLADFVDVLNDDWTQICGAISTLGNAEGSAAFDNATAFLRAFGHVVVGWLWLDQAITARRLLQSAEGNVILCEGKVAACRFYYEFEMPKVSAWLSPVVTRSDTARVSAVDIY
ncbi:acyl-CoA dehydrogenase [Methylobacterium aquaticum]|uniref:acyl-CoA dehydrogenase n=1 Tax=Methylobacterium aquaticum TaxID=270351 RepID=UPI003D17DC27